MSHSALLVIAGAVVTFVLAALVFRPTGTAEERRIREERRILRALEGQRRVQAARRAREEKRRMALLDVREETRLEPEAATQVIAEDAEAERNAAERERKRHEKDQAAALKAQRAAEKNASRRAEQERKAAAKAERAAERQRQKEEKAAAKAAQEQPVTSVVEEQLEPEAAPTEDDATTPLADLPLFSWANRIDDDAPMGKTR